MRVGSLVYIMMYIMIDTYTQACNYVNATFCAHYSQQTSCRVTTSYVIIPLTFFSYTVCERESSAFNVSFKHNAYTYNVHINYICIIREVAFSLCQIYVGGDDDACVGTVCVCVPVCLCACVWG
jgi:hypothetical protein